MVEIRLVVPMIRKVPILKNKAIPELVELVLKYQPDLIWADSGDAIGNGRYIGSQDLIAWLYNDSPVKENVVINDR